MSSPNATSSAISIGWPSPTSSNSSSRSGSFSSTSSSGSTWSAFSFASCASNLSCAYPSWPTRSSLSSSFSMAHNNNNDVPSSYISDFDLFPEDLEDGEEPVLEEAPALPRGVQAMPLLPIFASQRPQNKKRRSSKKQLFKLPGAMTPIAESPAVSE